MLTDSLEIPRLWIPAINTQRDKAARSVISAIKHPAKLCVIEYLLKRMIMLSVKLLVCMCVCAQYMFTRSRRRVCTSGGPLRPVAARAPVTAGSLITVVVLNAYSSLSKFYEVLNKRMYKNIRFDNVSADFFHRLH